MSKSGPAKCKCCGKESYTLNVVSEEPILLLCDDCIVDDCVKIDEDLIDSMDGTRV